MRPRSELLRVRLSFALASCVVASCGTLAAPSTGDVDLPASYVGPYQTLGAAQTPTGSSALIRADQTATQVDEPSVVRPTPTGRRIAFMTLSVPMQGDTIGRASERMTAPPGSLAFDGAMSAFHAEMPWEGTFVRSPDVKAIDATHLVMVYAAQGGIGLATSSDGITFVHGSAPIIAGDPMDGGTNAPVEPSIAQTPMGDWLLVFRRGTSLFSARARDPSGPWTENPTAILNPSQVESLDAGNAFDSVSLGDPALTILPTPAGRTLYVMFYTATGPAPVSAIGAAASYDGMNWSRLSRTVFVDRANNARAGSLEVVDPRTAFLWIGNGPVTNRAITALIGPVVARVSAPGS